MMYLDDLRVYNTMLKVRDIKILSGPSLVYGQKISQIWAAIHAITIKYFFFIF